MLVAALIASCVAARAQQTSQPAATAVVKTQPARTRPVASSVAQAPAPPVVAVVHRLSGWKLRAVVAPPDAPFAATFDDKFVRTNIVAGYVMPDGRSVVARLPQADSDVLSLSALMPDSPLASTPAAPSLTLVRADGAEFDARFVGLDESTGLSLFEASRQLMPPSAATARPPSAGQRVCVWAPLPAGTTVVERASAAPTTNAPRPIGDPSNANVPPTASALPRPSTSPRVSAPPPAGASAVASTGAPVGDEGVLYMNLGEIDGTLREVRRTPAGRAFAFTVETHDASPEWAGGVALTESNALVGIVEQAEGHEARLLPAVTVRAAAARVLARRASVPQPWLGARGDSVAQTPPDRLIAHGWPRGQAFTVVRRQQGVLLTSVAPDSPAAHAGLRPGDVVARVGAQDVRSVEDMTWVLKEVGGNSPAQFTVLRAGTPMTLRVVLSEAQNPAAATARAELTAAQSGLSRAQLEMNRVAAEMRRLQDEMARMQRDFSGAPAATNQGRASEEQLRAVREKLREIDATYREASQTVSNYEREIEEAQMRLRAAAAASPTVVGSPLLPLGAETRVFLRTTIINGVTQSLKGLVVVAVRPDSAASRADLRVGDLIETVNDEPGLGVEWKSKLARGGDSPITLGVTRDGKRLTLKLNTVPEK